MQINQLHVTLPREDVVKVVKSLVETQLLQVGDQLLAESSVVSVNHAFTSRRIKFRAHAVESSQPVKAADEDTAATQR